VETGPGQKPTVHARIDTVCRRKHLELAWEKGKSTRGSAGIDAVSIAAFEARRAYSVALLHDKLRDGTYQPHPVKRVESSQAEGGVRKLGIPAVLDRVCQQALVQRLEPICDPRFLDRSCGYRRGRSPHDALRQGWQELHAGGRWIVDADLHQGADTIDQEQLLDFSAAEIRDGRVLPRVRDLRRAGVMAGGGGKPTRTGVPQGGVASPLWANIFLTPCDRRRTAEGFRLTRGADDVVVWCQTQEEAQRAWAIAKRVLREE
jgi:group II intron reverse transcriptase/maturase